MHRPELVNPSAGILKLLSPLHLSEDLSLLLPRAIQRHSLLELNHALTLSQVCHELLTPLQSLPLRIKFTGNPLHKDLFACGLDMALKYLITESSPTYGTFGQYWFFEGSLLWIEITQVKGILQVLLLQCHWEVSLFQADYWLSVLVQGYF